VQRVVRRGSARAAALIAADRPRAGARLKFLDSTAQRVVITGIGALTPIGCGVDGLWSGVLGGNSAIRMVTRFDATPCRSRLAAELDDADFDPHRYLTPRRARRLDRFSQFSVIA